jgi:hypothetical protein
MAGAARFMQVCSKNSGTFVLVGQDAMFGVAVMALRTVFAYAGDAVPVQLVMAHTAINAPRTGNGRMVIVFNGVMAIKAGKGLAVNGHSIVIHRYVQPAFSASFPVTGDTVFGFVGRCIVETAEYKYDRQQRKSGCRPGLSRVPARIHNAMHYLLFESFVFGSSLSCPAGEGVPH